MSTSTRPPGGRLGRRLAAATAVLAAASLALTGCFGFQSTPGGDDDVVEFRFSYLPITSIDPHVVTGRWWFPVAGGLLDGLVAQNDDATGVVPAAAESWEISEDARTYTFTMREGATWSNGDPVTADDFVWTYQRLLDSDRSSGDAGAGANSYRTNMNIVGAREFLAGTGTWDEVGISAPDERTLVFELSAVAPDFLLDLTNYSMLPLHPATVEEYPQAWSLPENWVGNGPFVLESWEVNQSMVLVPNENYWNRDAIKIDRFVVEFTEAGNAAQLLAFQNDEIDAFQIEDLTLMPSDASLDSLISSVDGRGTQYLNLMGSEDSPLVDIRVREALALAIDRDQVASLLGGWQPGVSLLPSSVPGWSASMGIPFDPARARQLLADAGYSSGADFPTITLLSHSATSNTWLEIVAQMWEENLGITTDIDVLETGVYSDKRNEYHSADYFGYFARSFGGIPTLSTFVTAPNTLGPGWALPYGLDGDAYGEYRRMQADGDANAQQYLLANTDPKIAEFNALVSEALQTADEGARNALLLEATTVNQATYRFIPVGWQNVAYLVKDGVTGLHFRPTTEPFYLTDVEVTK